MQIMLILALCVALVAVVFAVSNTAVTQVEFLGITIYQGSLALVLLLSILVGVLISMLVSSPSMVRNRLTIRSLNKQLVQLQKELDEQAAKLLDTQKQLKAVEDELAAERQPALEEKAAEAAPEEETPVASETETSV